ncbi:MAG: pyridoxal 5'-phosphate synthase glutaminase subunit PdxT [Candidatus Marinimicrobia bacterium]|nr:pyridoxal 5'-phosphate synthase glutaminase subunit PdxT [Candidatus Neomarinimicrobiota bacterium]|tara:strand:+ start:468 stop:1013 length:546 start_codon:yes stop_codon:yes gene_type:complete
MHGEALKMLNIDHCYVKYPKDLYSCSALIIPGGESSSFSKLISKNNLLDCLKDFAEKKPVFGTCAGLIILSKINTPLVKGLGILDIDIERNGWGTQINSFKHNIFLPDQCNSKFNAVFIRAPRITNINDNNIKILSSLNGEPVLIQKKKCLGATFHPELTSNLTIHKYFIEMIDEKIIRKS